MNLLIRKNVVELFVDQFMIWTLVTYESLLTLIFVETSRSPENKRYKSPFKKRLEEKERLIENLAQDLRNKTQELIKFESINAQLTAKLRNFQVLFSVFDLIKSF